MRKTVMCLDEHEMKSTAPMGTAFVPVENLSGLRIGDVLIHEDITCFKGESLWFVVTEVLYSKNAKVKGVVVNCAIDVTDPTEWVIDLKGNKSTVTLSVKTLNELNPGDTVIHRSTGLSYVMYNEATAVHAWVIEHPDDWSMLERE